MTSKKKCPKKPAKCQKKPAPWHLEIVEGRPSFWLETTLWHVNIVGANGEIVYTRETGSEDSARVCLKRTAEETKLKIRESAKAAAP